MNSTFTVNIYRPDGSLYYSLLPVATREEADRAFAFAVASGIHDAGSTIEMVERIAVMKMTIAKRKSNGSNITEPSAPTQRSEDLSDGRA